MKKETIVRFKSAKALSVIILFLASECEPSKGVEDLGTLLGIVTVKAGQHQRTDTPVRYPCQLADLFHDHGTSLTPLASHHLVLEEEGGQRSRIDVQWDPEAGFEWESLGGRGALVWTLEGTTQKSSTRVFKLRLMKGVGRAGPFTVDDIDRRHLLLKKNGRAVLQFNYGIVRQIQGQKGTYDRAAYIHPVWTPTGKIITGDFSPEHIHQRGIFFAAHKVRFGEMEANFWELGQEKGRTLPDRLAPRATRGPVLSSLVVRNKGVVDNRVYFKEIVTTRVYSLPDDEVWLFDVSVRQVPVSPSQPHSLPKEAVLMEWQQVSYGGMAFRGTSEWLPTEASLDILTSEDKDRISANKTPARWIDYTGPLGNQWGGLVIFDHPANARYPTPLRVHEKLPYFCYPFFQNQPYIVVSNAPLDLTYRFLIHQGRPNKETNERVATDFIDPPEIMWKSAR